MPKRTQPSICLFLLVVLFLGGERVVKIVTSSRFSPPPSDNHNPEHRAGIRIPLRYNHGVDRGTVPGAKIPCYSDGWMDGWMDTYGSSFPPCQDRGERIELDLGHPGYPIYL